jgi:hypothetical protein
MTNKTGGISENDGLPYGDFKKLQVRFTPEAAPIGDEIVALLKADESIERFGTVDYADVGWG